EAQDRVKARVKLPPGYELEWAGEFESARRAGARLAIVVPLTLVAIFVLLFALFHNVTDAAIVFFNVLVASPVGGLAALLITGHQFSVSSAVGFLALFGVSIQIFGGEWRHDLRVRFTEDSRNDIGAIQKLLLPTDGGHLVPLSQVADVVVRGGASRIFRENGRRTLAIKFEVRGRDLGSTVDEAQELADGVHVPNRREFAGVREILQEYPEVRTLAVQIGRPDDGTDPVGFYNLEFLLVLKPKDDWRRQFDQDKEKLVSDIARKLDVIPGVTYGFSQPISDNVEEALTGVKGQLAIKITGDDLQSLDDLADQTAHAIHDVPGVADLGIIRQLGQSNVEVKIARDRAERYGLDVAEVEDAVEHGIGGAVVTQIFVIMVSYIDDLRRQGVGVDEAILRAAAVRLPPIVMTSLVATLGLIPAALSHGIGSDSQKPLAIVVVGGLFCSLVISLFTVPMSYKLLARRRGS
ncbi:efflux RND transporter permease subunit, partial [bacterium]